MSLFLAMLFSQWPAGVAVVAFFGSTVLAGQAWLVGNRMSGFVWPVLTIAGASTSAVSIFAVCDAMQRHPVRMEHELVAFAILMPLFSFCWAVFSWSAWRDEPAVIAS